MTKREDPARNGLGRRRFLTTTGLTGLAGIIASGRAPAFAQTQPKKLAFAHIVAEPESGAIGFGWMCQELTKRSGGALQVDFYGGTLLSKELEIMNAVKAGNIAMGDPAGAAATVFPEMGVFLVPYLVKSYDQAYAMFNGKIGDQLDKQFQEKYKVKVLCFFDYGFRQFWNSKHPIVEPKDLRGMKMRVQQGVIDGADLPVINILALKAYEVSKYASMTYHNYGPTLTVINLDIWNGLTKDQQKLMLDVAREAQVKIRQMTESIDNLAKAKELLEPKGMTVNAANVDAFRTLAQKKVWPEYQKQYSAMWEQIANYKV